MSADIKKIRKKDTAATAATATPETDIEKYIEKQIEIKLNSLLETLPDKIPKDQQIKPIYNLTIKELYKNTLQTLIDIITDIVDVYSKKDYVNSNNYIYILLSIFTKDDRKIYVGIMLVVLSFIVYFVDGVSV
jgi:DNA-directed RNA polymerase